jgi:hypothetical protein
MTEPNNRQLAARKRAAEQKRLDPMFYKRKGSIPKRDTGTPRGFQVIDSEIAREIQSAGGRAGKGVSKKKNDLIGKDEHE